MPFNLIAVASLPLLFVLIAFIIPTRIARIILTALSLIIVGAWFAFLLFLRSLGPSIYGSGPEYLLFYSLLYAALILVLGPLAVHRAK